MEIKKELKKIPEGCIEIPLEEVDYIYQPPQSHTPVIVMKQDKNKLDQSQKQPEKQEEWERELRFTYGHLYYQNEEGEFCQIVNEIDDLIDFISQLLSEEYQRGVKEGTEGKFYEKIEVVSQIPEEVVEQLLSERTFSKEELRLLNAYLSLALPEYNNFDKETKMHEDMDKLHKILEKLSKLLKEEE